MHTLSNVKTPGGEASPPSARFAPDAFPEAKSSKTGVSVRYEESHEKSWYVFRASYGREDNASDYLVDDGTYTYIAKKLVEKYVKGKRVRHMKNLIPSLLFAYTTEAKAEEYVANTPALSYLTYYYNHFAIDDDNKNPPLTVPPKEMGRFIKATATKNKHLQFVESAKCHFKTGDMVKVMEGPFEGVEGRVARVAGQQRVVVALPGIGMVSTAYIPSAFLESLT